jgi:hypothetical protein
MRTCDSCLGKNFTAAFYPTAGVWLPALECARCGSLLLDEELARSDEERAQIADAIEMRKAFSTVLRDRLRASAATASPHVNAIDLVESNSEANMKAARIVERTARPAPPSSPPPAESGTHQISAGLSVADVERTCAEIEVAVAELRLCLDFLKEVITWGESAKAVSDARVSARRVDNLVEDLGQRCAVATRTRNKRATAWKR